MNAPVDVSFFARAAKPLSSYRKYWAARFGTAPFLPMSRAEMDKLGWDSCDIVLVTGDAYVDHPSFGMAVIGRMLGELAHPAREEESCDGAEGAAEEAEEEGGH